MNGLCPEGVGPPQAPDWPLLRPVEHACGVAFSLPLVAVPAHFYLLFTIKGKNHLQVFPFLFVI